MKWSGPLLGLLLFVGSAGCKSRPQQGKELAEDAQLGPSLEEIDRVLLEDRTPIVPPPGTIVFGNEDALVTIVEFADFHCPYCARTSEIMKNLVKKYEGDVRVVFMQMPLPIHPDAESAALSSLAAGKQGKFWEAHDAHFAKRIKSEQDHRALVEELGIDWDQYEADRKSDELKSQVKADMALARKVGVTGTPASFIARRASVLSPMRRITSAEGPMNLIPRSAQISASSAFSERKS